MGKFGGQWDLQKLTGQNMIYEPTNVTSHKQLISSPEYKKPRAKP
jgi:hypothetical protein